MSLPLHALLVMAKRPSPGRTKTRLSPPLSPKAAGGLYECFLLDTLDLVRQVPDVHKVIAFTPKSASGYFSKLAADFELIPQTGSNLGSRLDNALSYYLLNGFTQVVIMNSDGPTLPVEYLIKAHKALAQVDVVLGPSEDGGYYLIGLKKPAPRLLRDVHMSTPRVTSDTLRIADSLGLRVHLLPGWYDIDDVETLDRLLVDLEQSPRLIAPQTRRYLKQINMLSTR
ncbi:MAG TPA: TIGR04282 family arsenosugar biosynthesis glycosyltransferase [Anaerolineales bacterium]